MKNFILLILFILISTQNMYAGEYEGLTPGVSTKADADKVLGESVKYDSKNKIYNYSPEGHDLAALSIHLNDNNIIDRIHLVFLESYDADQIKEWFGLPNTPTSAKIEEDHLVELYNDQGIKITHKNATPNSAIIQLSHVYLSENKQTAQKPKIKSIDSCPESAETFAQKADPFIKGNQYRQAIPHLKQAVECNPNKIIYSSMLAYAYWETGDLNNAINIAKQVIDKDEDYISYSILGNAYWQKKDYRKAIPYLEKAVTFKEDRKKHDNLEFLGSCYYEEGRLQKALTSFAKSYKRNKRSPISIYYIALISDRLGEKGDARLYYKKYLELNHNNKDMQSAAKERLSILNREKTSKKNISNKAVNLFKTIQQELKDF